MVKIEFYNLRDLGNILYSSGFHQVVYLDTIVKKPEYPINQSAKEDGNGNTFFDFQSWDKQRVIETNVQEDLADCLTLLPLHDVVRITDDLYKQEVLATNITVNASWIDQAEMIAKLTIKYSVMSIRRTGKLDNINRTFEYTMLALNSGYAVPLSSIEGEFYLEGYGDPYFIGGSRDTYLNARVAKIVNKTKVYQSLSDKKGNIWAFNCGIYGNIYWQLENVTLAVGNTPEYGQFVKIGFIDYIDSRLDGTDMKVSISFTPFNIGWCYVYYRYVYQGSYGTPTLLGTYSHEDCPPDEEFVIPQDIIGNSTSAEIWLVHWIHGQILTEVSKVDLFIAPPWIPVVGYELEVPLSPHTGDFALIAYPNVPDCYLDPPCNTVAYARLYKFIYQTGIEQEYNDFIGCIFKYEAGQYGGIYWKLECTAYVGTVRVGRFVKIGAISGVTVTDDGQGSILVDLTAELFTTGTAKILYREDGGATTEYWSGNIDYFPLQLTFQNNSQATILIWIEYYLENVLISTSPEYLITLS